MKFLEAYDGADDAMISPAAEAALGNAYAHLKQLDKAVTHLILESQGKNDEALKLYQTVKEKYFNSMQYQTIDAYIERVSAK